MESCPYKGLLPYREQDARYFFGRDTERRLIRDNLRASRLTILYGTSGTGKSSVLGAGVAHDLKDDPDYLLVYFGTPGTWRNDPVSSLNAAVEEKLSVLPGYEPNGGNGSNHGLFHGLESRLVSVDRTLLVILDQFEEYFQYHGAEDGENTFAMEFPRILRQERIPVHFLLSVREDAIATLDRFKKRIPALFNNRMRIEFLSRESALE
ncbi:MAG: ATP-binding protein, partial [Candidatus Sulfotelmatobacter sp.]